MKIRFGIRSLLLLIMLTATFFPFRNLYDNWFRTAYSGYHTHDVLGHRVFNGDSFEHVSNLFDHSTLRTEQWVKKHLGLLPDYEDGDEYHEFHIDGGNVRGFFQFRDNSVVNHDNSLFLMPYSQVQHFNDSASNLMLRHGAFPVYIVLVVLAVPGAFLIVRLANKKRIVG